MYFVFVGTFLLLGAVLPSIFLLFLDESESMWDQMVTPSSIPEGLRYTLFASLIFVGLALAYRPRKPRSGVQPVTISPRLVKICWHLGMWGYVITALLSVRYGMSSSNLTAQRPPGAVYIGYLAVFGTTAGAAFFYHELRFVGLSRRLVLFLLVQCIALATSWSRSAVVFLGLAVLLGLAYSQKARVIRIPKARTMWLTALIVPASVASAIYGQSLRGGDTSIRPFLFEGMQRLFANNVALFLAIDRHEDVNRVLLEDEPEVLIDQMLSFVRTRTKYPSSFRFVEVGGGTVQPDERGHIAGYAYGWLGVTYGVGYFWGGLLWVACVLWVHFCLMLACHRRSRSLLAMLFFSVFAGSLMEFLFNLGIDSFGEKLFKNSLYAVITYFIVAGIDYISRGSPTATNYPARRSGHQPTVQT